MADKFKLRVRWIRYTGVVALAVAIVWAAIHYNRYAYAIVWHCTHKSYAQAGGYKVRLPMFWWVEKDPAHFDTYLLLRACPSSTSLPPRLTVRPALRGTVRATNEEQLKAIQTLIALKDSKSIAGSSSSLVILHSKQFTLYCEKIEFAPFGVAINTSLYCTAAKVSSDWSYFGPPSYEDEVKFILSTLG